MNKLVKLALALGFMMTVGLALTGCPSAESTDMAAAKPDLAHDLKSNTD